MAAAGSPTKFSWCNAENEELTTRVRISYPQRKPEPEEQPPLDRPDPIGMLLPEPEEETR